MLIKDNNYGLVIVAGLAFLVVLIAGLSFLGGAYYTCSSGNGTYFGLGKCRDILIVPVDGYVCDDVEYIYMEGLEDAIKNT